MAADRGSENESRRQRKSESQSQGSVNGDEMEEPDFSDQEGFLDDISDEGCYELQCIFCAIWVGSVNTCNNKMNLICHSYVYKNRLELKKPII